MVSAKLDESTNLGLQNGSKKNAGGANGKEESNKKSSKKSN